MNPTNNPVTTPAQNPVEQAIEISIRLGLLLLLAIWCLDILKPFISVILWAAVIAIAMHTPFLKLERILGGRRKLAVTVFIVGSLTVILVPSIMLSDSLYESATGLKTQITEGTLHIPPPADSVKEWPLVGEKVYAYWREASQDLVNFLTKHRESLSSIGKKVIGAATGVGASILQFVVATLIAGVFLASAETSGVAMRGLSNRLAGEYGDELVDLSISTVKSVAVGVLGIAFIQAMLGAVGMLFVGVPAVGLWALAILVLAIAQLPPILILGPVAIYVFSVESTTVSVLFLTWSIIVSFSDMVLKPLLLGRGVEVPMLVILLGAIGGMLTAGIIGLFLGAVILTLAYKLFIAWLALGDSPADEPADVANSST